MHSLPNFQPRLPELRPPELLAPAGDWDCVRAAIENGADAIYFGLDTGFNARRRATNFGIHDLDELMATLRLRDVRGYVTLNTLVFPSELRHLIEAVERIAASGVDAVLVQDFGVAELVKKICPDLELHASTQMSLTSAETITAAAKLGLDRVVLARELSIDEIREIRSKTNMPLEAFIHGALCVAYSGQCLTSESLGGRSANRGQCAQACRLPYELVVDGVDRDLGDVRYLLSPQDLAGYAAIPDMIAAGIDSLKIEGRLKTPQYVANITRHYRIAIDQAVSEGKVSLTEQQQQEMELSFSRGFTPGWLRGNDHKQLVPGVRSAKQGLLIGRVREIRRDEILVDVAADVSLGDGLAVASSVADHSNKDPRYARSGHADNHQGGRIYSLRKPTGHWSEKIKGSAAGSEVWIGFGRGEIDFGRVEIDAEVFKNDDPALNKRLTQSYTGKPKRTRGIDFAIRAVEGELLAITATSGNTSVQWTSDFPVQRADRHVMDEDTLTEKLGRLGGTTFHLRSCKATIVGRPMVPLAVLNAARREIVDRLIDLLRTSPVRSIDMQAAVRLIETPLIVEEMELPQRPQLVVLCRTKEQLLAAVDAKVDQVVADFHDVREHRDAVSLAKQAGVPIFLASIRMQKPGEMGLVKQLVKYQPDGILARNLAAMDHALAADLSVVADFSLNVANQRTANWLMHAQSRRLTRMTPSYDLNADQLDGLISAVPASWWEIVIHQRMPMFHMEHCVFCSVLSPGTNKTNCGRPCDSHVVKLRDRVGQLHVLQADIACRNTLYNATAQSAAEVVVGLIDRGVRWFRVECLDESGDQTRATLEIYRQLLNGKISGSEVWRRLSADNRVGVTRGTLEAKRNPLAIL